MSIFGTERISRRGQLSIGLLAVLALALTVGLSFFVRDYVRAIAVAQQDQVSWRAAQLEIEYLKLTSAIEKEKHAETPDLGNLRKRFDVFYSRLPLIRPETLEPEASERLAEMQALLDRLIPVIDGSDAELAAQLDFLGSELATQEASPRFIALGTIRGVSDATTLERKRIIWLLEAMLGLIVVTTIVLIMSIVFLIRRTASLQIASISAEEKHQQLTAVLNGAFDAIVVTDHRQRVIDFNSSAEKIFGYSAEDVLGRNGLELLTPASSHDALTRDLQAYLKTEKTQFLDQGRQEMNMLRADGSEFPGQFTSSTAQTRDGPIFISYIRDVTGDKRREQEIIQARDTALQAYKERSRFFAMMSHEMRTPLNGVMSSLYLLDESPLCKEQREHLKTALFSGDILMSHINDVLAIERSESEEEFAPSACDIAALTSSMVAMLKPMARNGEVAFDLQQKGLENRHFLTSPRAIQQILTNLLSNAIKFSSHGAVSLFAHYTPSGDQPGQGMLRFEVSDTGIGIAPGDQKRIFEDFVSLDSRYERRTGGTGLGLGIVRRFVEQLGGTIECESELGAGSTFIVELPLREVTVDSQVKKADPLQSASTTRPKRILVVDDNNINRDLLRKMLELSSHKVTTADGGQMAIDMAAEQPFDLILMDISMPDISGTQATRRIRAAAGPNQTTPIVAFTAQAMPQEQEGFRKAGMSGFLLKPVNRKALQECVQKKYRAVDVGQGQSDDPAAESGTDSGTDPGTSGQPLLDPEQVSDLLELLGHDQLRERFDACCRDAQDLMAKLEVARDQGDYAQMQSASHELAGMCGMMGATGMQMLFSDIERACKTGERDKADALTVRIPNEFATTRAAWEAVLA